MEGESGLAKASRCAGPFGRRGIARLLWRCEDVGGVWMLGDREGVGSVRMLGDREGVGSVGMLGDREDVGSVGMLGDREDVGSVRTLGDREASEVFILPGGGCPGIAGWS